MQGEPNYSSQIAYEIDKEVQRIVKEQYERCKQILLEHKEQLILIAETLLTEETLVAEQIQSLFYEGKLPEIDYDAAKVVKDEDSEFNDGKFGKSYEEIRKEQLEDGNVTKVKIVKKKKILLRIKEADKSDEKMNQHIDKPQISKTLRSKSPRQ